MRLKAVVFILSLPVVLSCSTMPQSGSAHSDQGQTGYSNDDVIPLGDGVYEITDTSRFVSAREISRRLRARAAEFTLASGHSHFRILDSWNMTTETAFKTILIRPTDDPDDISAEWVLSNQ